MASDSGSNNDPTGRRRRIAEKGSNRLALITGGWASNPQTSTAPHSHHSYNSSCPPSLTDENLGGIGGSKVPPVLQKAESTKLEASRELNEGGLSQMKLKNKTSANKIIYLYKILCPNQLRPAILVSQDIRRKCSFFAGIVVVLSYMGFPVLGSYIIRSIILSRPLVLLLLINGTITVGPLILDAVKLTREESNDTSEETDLPDILGSPFEWVMLFKTGLSAYFMDSCMYLVVIICGVSVFKKLGL